MSTREKTRQNKCKESGYTMRTYIYSNFPSFRKRNCAATVFYETYTVCRCTMFTIEFARSKLKTNSFAIFFSRNGFNVLIDFYIATYTHTTIDYVCNAVCEFSPSHELGFDSVSKSASSSSNSGSPLGSSNTFQKQLLPTKKKFHTV